jgi:hypothetical protein
MSSNILSCVSKNILLILCQHGQNILKKIWCSLVQSCSHAHAHA